MLQRRKDGVRRQHIACYSNAIFWRAPIGRNRSPKVIAGAYQRMVLVLAIFSEKIASFCNERNNLQLETTTMRFCEPFYG